MPRKALPKQTADERREPAPLTLPCHSTAGANIKSPLSKSPLPAVAITVDCRSSLGGSALGGSMGGSGCGVDAPATAAAAPPADLSVWEGIKHMLRNPHHAAFFATALLMGIG